MVAHIIQIFHARLFINSTGEYYSKSVFSASGKRVAMYLAGDSPAL